jgi:very-short-patch-repair endonuclease
MTDAERVLWSKLRMKQLHGLIFTRQKPLGEYIADFYCHKVKLVVEVDGGQHYSGSYVEHDRARDNVLRNKKLAILRFTNLDVLGNIDGVIEKIVEHIDKNSLNPSLRKRETRKGRVS